MQTKKIFRFQLILLFVLGASLSRLIPHPANFTALVGAGLFCGFYLKNIFQSIGVVLGAMIFTDLLIGLHQLAPIVYIALITPVIIGRFIQNSSSKKKVTRASWILCGSVCASLSFFITTNFAVWAFTPLYSKTINGLMLCYTAALPFFQNQLIGDLFYTGLLFGGFLFAKRISEYAINMSQL